MRESIFLFIFGEPLEFPPKRRWRLSAVERRTKKTFHTESILKTLLSTLLRATGENNLFRLFQDTPPLDVERMTQTLKEKNVTASSLKFGFLGLGIMGSGMVKNLLNSGHKVIVWNRTTEKVSLSSSSFFLFFSSSFLCRSPSPSVLLPSFT